MLTVEWECGISYIMQICLNGQMGEMVVWEYSKDTVDAKVYNTIHKEMEGNVPMKSYTLFNQWSIKLHSQH